MPTSKTLLDEGAVLTAAQVADDDLFSLWDTSEPGLRKHKVILGSQMKLLSGAIVYQSTWNASTNTPTLADGVGTKGHYYVVSADGSTSIDGISVWNLGDWIIFNGTVWEKVDNTDLVASVHGRVGVVVSALSDYDASQIDNDSVVVGATVKDALDTLDAAGISFPVPDTTILVKGSADPTKLLRFEVDGFTNGVTRVATFPDKNITLDDVGDARTPTLHAASHLNGGGDAIKLDDLGAPDDNTALDASLTKHGLLLKLGGGSTNFLRADGTWALPPDIVAPTVDTTPIIKGSVDATKLVRFEVDGLTTATTRVITVPDKDITLLGELKDDTSPQAGGDFDLQAFKIFTSTVNGNIVLEPNGSGGVGVGRADPDSILHLKANTPGTVGNFPAGQLILQTPDDDVTSNVAITAYKSDVGGDPDVQLWYLGSGSSSNEDIILLNRRNAAIMFSTNNTVRMTILAGGNITITGTLDGRDISVDGDKLDAITGTNTGDQTITLTGDVTGSGTGTFSATIADNAVGLDEMAHGTDGNLITFDAAGAPVYVSTGLATEVLTSNGAGAAPTFQAAPGGGISNVVEDTTPQLGGDLDPNGFNVDAGTEGTDIIGTSVKIIAGTGGIKSSLNTNGGNLFLTAGDGGAGAGNTGIGGLIILEPGEPAAGGSIPGYVRIMQAGGVAGTDELRLSHDGTDAVIESKSGDIKLIPAGGDLNLTGNIILSGTVDGRDIAADGTILDTAVLDTLADAKGDIFAATAADIMARLAIGTNDQVLTADSAQATGLKWATASGGINNVVEDTTPQLGGDLDVYDGTTNHVIKSTHSSGDVIIKQTNDFGDFEVEDKDGGTSFDIRVSGGGTDINASIGMNIKEDGGFRLRFDNGVKTYQTINVNSDNSYDLGTSTARFKNHYYTGFMEHKQITTPANPSTDSGRIYTKDVAGTAEWFAMDEGGTESQLSPHNTTAPDWFYDRKGVDEVHISTQHYLGLVTYTNVTRAARLAGMLDAEKSNLTDQQRTTVLEETFVEYNTRMGENLKVWDWDSVQNTNQIKYNKDRTDTQTELEKWNIAKSKLIAERTVVFNLKSFVRKQKKLDKIDKLILGYLEVEPVVPLAKDIRKPLPTWLQLAA